MARMLSHTAEQSITDQPCKVANPARGQLNRANYFFLSPFTPDNLVSGYGLDRPVPRQPACSFSILRLNLVLTHGIPPDFRGSIHLFKPPYAIRSVPSLSGHAIAYRRRSLPRVGRHRARSPQGSSRNGYCLSRSPWTN